MNIINDLLDYIDSKVTSYVAIRTDILGQDESIILRQLPSEAVVTRYMDGSRESSFDFAMMAKSMDQVKAINQLLVYQDILDIPNDLQLTEDCSIKVEPTSNPILSGTNEDQSVVYTSSFTLEYFIEGNQ